MASPFKQSKRWLSGTSGAAVMRATQTRGAQRSSPFARVVCYADMLFVDFGVIRFLTHNRHRLRNDVWRSGQPSPHHISGLARQGLRTVINLRGDQSAGTRWLEHDACQRHGIKLINLSLRSRSAPSKDELRAARQAIQDAAYPILVHCKSGADRVGLMSVLIEHERHDVPIALARKQLSLRYGHIRQAETGVLDAVFDRYVQDTLANPISFWTWVETTYDPHDIEGRFRARPWATRLVNTVLRRE